MFDDMKLRIVILVLAGFVTCAPVRAEDLSDVILRARKNPAYLTSFIERSGFDISATDSQGWSLILWAAQAGEADMIRVLAKRGANLNQISKEKYQVTPLVCAADRGWPDAVATLIELGAAVKGETGYRAVQCASSYNTDNHAKCILILAKAGADLNSEKEPEKSAVKDTIVYHRHKCLAALLQGGANVNARWSNDMTPLTYAVAISGDPKATKIVLSAHADINAKARFPFAVHGFPDIPLEERYHDRTALMCAAGAGRLDLVKILIEAGAGTNVTDRKGVTAIDIAKQFGHSNVVEYLQNKSTSNQ